MNESERMYGESPGVTTNEPAFIEAVGLGVRYRKTIALRDVNLPIFANRVTALIGPSGCGKTSFLNCVNRMSDLIPSCTVTGSLYLEDTNLLKTDLDVVAHRRRVGMLFQKPNPFPMSIQRNIALALAEHGVRNRSAQEDTVEESLQSVGLWDEVKDRLHKSALSLSGGQQQRLCLARALALRPMVMLMDEPCSSLDPISSGVIEELIRELREQVTIVIVTHNLAQAKRVSDDVGFLSVKDGAGELVEFGPTHEMFSSPRNPLTAAYLKKEKG